MHLPAPRGPLSTEVLGALACDSPGGSFGADAVLSLVAELPSSVDPVTDDDFHLALWVMYELAYRGFDEVDPEWEWDPELLRARRALDVRFEAELRMRTSGYVEQARQQAGDVPDQLFALTESMNGPSIARHIQRRATPEQFSEFMKQRSIYHLKESDPHSFVLPRLDGAAKVALAELQYDEYGGGRPARLHAAMFGDSLEAAGLDRAYGAYIDQVPGYTLAINNAMSLFGLHRRLRAAALGHLGAFEATSSLPCRRVAGGIRRLRLSETVAAYFDEHVEADAVHEQLAFRDICGTIAAEEPDRVEDLFFGAAVCLYLDAVAGQEMIDAWEHGGSSLLAAAEETVA
jgi:hypothetical protein